MSRFQAGALVVYGNLGVHEVEGVGLRRFCDESAREYYTLRPYFSDSHDRSYIPTEKEAALRPVTPAQQAEADLARIKAEKLPIPAGVQTALAEHYQALLHTNDFYQYLTLFKELGLFSASDEMLAFGVPALRIISVTFLFAVITILCGYFASGLGNGVVNMIGGALRQLAVLVPCLWLLIRTMGIDRAWFAFWVSEVIACAYSLWATKKELRNKEK